MTREPIPTRSASHGSSTCPQSPEEELQIVRKPLASAAETHVDLVMKSPLRPGSRSILFLASLLGSLVPCTAAAQPPDYFARIISDGNVTFKFYDPLRQPRIHRGYTTFRLDVLYRSTYQYRWTDLADSRQLAIDATIGQITYKLTNEVQLPDTLNHDLRWTDSLLRHEFDHVAMTLDPRVRLLVERLCRSTPQIVRQLPSGTPPTDSLMDRLVSEAVEPRYQAVLKLLIANESDLDKVTHHGGRRIDNRRTYFEALFTEPNLKQHGFPYLDEVKQLLREKHYRQAPLPYRFDD